MVKLEVEVRIPDHKTRPDYIVSGVKGALDSCFKVKGSSKVTASAPAQPFPGEPPIDKSEPQHISLTVEIPDPNPEYRGGYPSDKKLTDALHRGSKPGKVTRIGRYPKGA